IAATVEGYAGRLVQVCLNRQATVAGVALSAAASHGCDDASSGNFADPVVPRVCNIETSGAIEGYPGWDSEAAAKISNKQPAGRYLENIIVPCWGQAAVLVVRNVEIGCVINSHSSH